MAVYKAIRRHISASCVDGTCKLKVSLRHEGFEKTLSRDYSYPCSKYHVTTVVQVTKCHMTTVFQVTKCHVNTVFQVT